MNLKELFSQTLRVPYTEVEETAASYCFRKRGDTLFLFFEKSNGAADWKNNLDFPAKPYREMERTWFVHRGFLRVFRSLEEPLARAVTGEGVAKIVISGYSHGAALALLCHEYCVYHRPDLEKTISGFGFGCPRVVWGYLPKEVGARFKNFTVVRNCRDVVTHLPPALLGYRHVGKLLHIGRGTPQGGVESHLAENYLDALSREVT